MKLDFLVASANEMIDDMRGRGVAACAAEPLLANETLDNALRIVNAAVAVTGLV